MTSVVQDIVNALSLGGLFALAALGIALIFGVMRLINFAHGELIMAGAYGLWAFRGLPWPLMVLATVALVAALAVVMERVAFRPVRQAAAATLLVTSFFVSSILQNSTIIAVGSRSKQINIFPNLLDSVEIGGVRLIILDLVTLGVSFALLIGVGVFLSRTLPGMQIRASSENFTMARLLGIRGNRVIPVAFVISGLLAAAVAVFLIARTGNVHPVVGLQPAVIGFIATVLGGIGSLRGAVAGAFVLAGLRVGLQSGLPTNIAPYRDAFVFSGVILILLWKPDGLLPTKLTGDRV